MEKILPSHLLLFLLPIFPSPAFPTYDLSFNLNNGIVDLSYNILSNDTIDITKSGSKIGNGTYSIKFYKKNIINFNGNFFDVSLNYTGSSLSDASGNYYICSVPGLWLIKKYNSSPPFFDCFDAELISKAPYSFNWGVGTFNGNDNLLTIGPMILGASDILNYYNFPNSIEPFIGLSWTTQLLSITNSNYANGSLDCSFNSSNNIITIYLYLNKTEVTFQAPPLKAKSYNFSFTDPNNSQQVDISYNIINDSSIEITKSGGLIGNGTYKFIFTPNPSNADIFDVSSNFQGTSGNFSITRTSSILPLNYFEWKVEDLNNSHSFKTFVNYNQGIYSFNWKTNIYNDNEKILLIAPMIIGASDLLNIYNNKGTNPTLFIGPSWITQLCLSRRRV